MSYRGLGVVPGLDGLNVRKDDIPEGAKFVPLRLKPRSKSGLLETKSLAGAKSVTCLLCGGLIDGELANDEHPIPQWLQRFTDTTSEPTPEIQLTGQTAPRRIDYAFQAHTKCNSAFGVLEERASFVIKAIVAGGKIKRTELDCVLDWLDKMRTTVALSALQSEDRLFENGVRLNNFPNLRVGLHDRLALFYRIDGEPRTRLYMINPQDPGFLSTPSALLLQINNLCIITVSDKNLLTPTFGLSRLWASKRQPMWRWDHPGMASRPIERATRLPAAISVYQAMRCQSEILGFCELSPALTQDGSGRIFLSQRGSFEAAEKNIDFSKMPLIRPQVGVLLGCLEVVEWLIHIKRWAMLDWFHMSDGEQTRPYFWPSIDSLAKEHGELVSNIGSMFGLPVDPEDHSTKSLAYYERLAKIFGPEFPYQLQTVPFD